MNSDSLAGNDFCLRGITSDGSVRFWIAKTTELCREAASRHKTSPTATVALGRLLCAAAIMGLMLKDENESVMLRIEGDGPLGVLTSIGTTDGKVRGYCNNAEIEYPSIWKDKIDIGYAVGGNGTLTVVKDLKMKEPYVGVVPLVTGQIGEDLAHYFAYSEQIPTALSLGVLLDKQGEVKAAGGYILQLMPGAPADLIDGLEKNISSIPHFANLIDEDIPLEIIADRLLKPYPWRELSRIPLAFSCNCGQEKLALVLKKLGLQELRDILNKQGQAELICSFCGERYHFSALDLQRMISELDDNQCSCNGESRS